MRLEKLWVFWLYVFLQRNYIIIWQTKKTKSTLKYDKQIFLYQRKNMASESAALPKKKTGKFNNVK